MHRLQRLRQLRIEVGWTTRPGLGSTSTILTQYLQAANVEPPLPLATALFYGIKTITMGLSRDTSSADAAAYSYLQPRIDVAALAKIEQTTSVVVRHPCHYRQRPQLHK